MKLQEAIDKGLDVVDKDDLDTNFWGHNYLVMLDRCTSVVVNAEYMGHALDAAIDYAETQGWDGLFLDNADVMELMEEYGEEWDTGLVCGGNHYACLVENGEVWELE